MMDNPVALLLGGVTLIVVILIMMREQKARNLKEFTAKYDIKDADLKNDEGKTEDKE